MQDLRRKADTVRVRVIGCCTYSTTIPYRLKEEYDAHDFVHAVKGRALNGYTGVVCRGVRLLIFNTNLDRALEILGILTSDLAIDPLPLDAKRPERKRLDFDKSEPD